jgi:hypothetical protein
MVKLKKLNLMFNILHYVWGAIKFAENPLTVKEIEAAIKGNNNPLVFPDGNDIRKELDYLVNWELVEVVDGFKFQRKKDVC